MKKRQPIIEFEITYEQNPAYEGDFQIPIVPGKQNAFPIRYLQEAIAVASSCKRWFNREMSIIDEVDEETGKVKPVTHCEVHDNVIVTITKSTDGVEEVIEWTEEKEPQKEKKKNRQLAMR